MKFWPMMNREMPGKLPKLHSTLRGRRRGAEIETIYGLHQDLLSRHGSRLGGHFPHIAFFAMLGKVKPLNLMFFGDSQADNHVHELKYQ